MHNVRKTPRIVKKQRENDASISKNFKSHCSCPNNTPFKNDQSKGHDETHSNNNSHGKTAQESEEFLRNEWKKYGLTPKTEKISETKHFNSPKRGGRVDIDLKSVPEDRIIKVNIKEIMCKNKYKSKTEPNLSNDKYVENLKEEIKSNSREIPSLPEKYKKKYLRSLKEELYLNKLTTHHDNSRQIEDIKREIETFRSYNSPYAYNVQDSKNDSGPTELKITIHRKDHKLKHPSERHKRKLKETKSEAGDGYNRHLQPHYDIEKRKRHASKTKHTSRENEDFRSLPTPEPKEEKAKTNPVKNYATISTQCEIELFDDPIDSKIDEKWDAIHDLIPQISSVIEKSEKKLEKVFKNAMKSPKMIQDRGVSPIKNIFELNAKPEDKKKIPKTPSHSVQSSELSLDQPAKEYHPLKPVSIPSNSETPNIGDLIINTQIIKDSRNLFSGFQSHVQQLKKDIENCEKCKRIKRNKKNVNVEKNYCEKHAIYIPLLKLGDQGSKSDQIKLFNALKTEACLKKELDKLIQHISQLEKKISKARKSNDLDEIKPLERELDLAKSYFNNLIVKQQNERVLTEQQKIMKDKNEHECPNIENCDKCGLQRQIQDLLNRVRENITKDIEDSKQRLKIQKMPNIDIRKSLQFQNILKLDIPPSSPPKISARSNFVFEAVVEGEVTDDDYPGETRKTKILVNKSTNIEVSPNKNDDSKRIVEKAVPNIQKKDFKIIDGSSKGKQDTLTSSTKASPKGHIKPTRKSKTPSELGFRRNVGTQCDSTTYLMEPVDPEPNTKMTAQTQTGVGREDSSYLFGFKEYLMKEAGSSPAKQVDVMLQTSLGSSSDSVIESKSVGVGTQENGTFSKVKNRDIQEEVDLVAPRSEDQFDKELGDTPLSSFIAEDDFSQANDREANEYSKSLQQTPSLKKMLLPPSTFPQSQHAALESSIQNPYIEPKYRMKRFSVTRPESDIEQEKQHGDSFYKSLIKKEELPERRPASWPDSRSNMIIPSTGIQDSSSANLGSLQHEPIKPDVDEHIMVPPEDSELVGSLVEPSVETKEAPKPTSDENTSEKLDRNISASSKDGDQTGKSFASFPNATRTSLPKEKSFDEKQEDLPQDIKSKKSNLVHRESSKTKDEDQTKVLFTSLPSSERSLTLNKTANEEPGHISDENFTGNWKIRKAEDKSNNDDQNTQNTEEFADNQAIERSNANKSIIIDSEPQPKLTPEKKHSLQSLEKDPSTKSIPEEKLYRYVPDENDIYNPLSNAIEQQELPKKESVPEETLNRHTTNSENIFANVFRELKEPVEKPTPAEFFEYMEDPEISKQDSIETPIKPLKNKYLTEALKNSKHQETGIPDSEGTQIEEPPKSLHSEETKLKNATKIDETRNEQPENTTASQSESHRREEAQNGSDANGGLLELTDPAQEQPVGQSSATEETVLPLFPPTYKLIVNKDDDFQTKLSGKNLLLRYPELQRRKSLKIIGTSPHSSEKTGGINLVIKKDHSRRDKKSVSDLTDTEELIISSSPFPKSETINVTNYILPVPNSPMLDSRTCSGEFRSDVPKITKERLEYSRRCSNFDNSSVDSSLISSVGEVKCHCKNISAGEIHSCPQERTDRRRKQSGINYKENLSSHLLLEKERKHYNHWVTYYATKKYMDESSSGSSRSDSVNNN